MIAMFDTNVMLDVFQGRRPFADHSGAALDRVVKGTLHGVFPAHGLTTAYYLLRKHAGHAAAIETVDWILRRFTIAPATAEVFAHARQLPVRDFEDAVVAAMALASHCDVIVTRNVDDFAMCGTPALTPENFNQATAE